MHSSSLKEHRIVFPSLTVKLVTFDLLGTSSSLGTIGRLGTAGVLGSVLLLLGTERLAGATLMLRTFVCCDAAAPLCTFMPVASTALSSRNN